MSAQIDNKGRKILCCVLVCSILLYGCTHTKIYAPEHLLNDSSKKITVFTTDGRVIQFEGGKYKVSEDGYGQISGKGLLVINKEKGKYKDFEGTISFNEIRNITITESTPLAKAAIIAWIAIGAILVWLTLFPPIIDID